MIDWIAVEDRKPDDLIEESEIDCSSEEKFVWHISKPVLAWLSNSAEPVTAQYIPDDPGIGECWSDLTTGCTLENVVAWAEINPYR